MNDDKDVITEVRLKSRYSVRVENDEEKEKTQLSVADWSLVFTTRQQVYDHIALLNKAMEFWEYE